jgi:hypothetical protein
MAEPTITDEELAEVVRAIHFYCGTQSHKANRLIAVLRAERQAAETNAAKAVELEQRLATVRALHPRVPDGLCPRCRVDWPCETAEAVGE